MKRIILSLTFLITSLFAYSQKDTIYYNAELLIVDSLRATFYRVCKVNYYERRIEGMFSDYNYWTRKRIAEGNYTLGEKNGTFKKVPL